VSFGNLHEQMKKTDKHTMKPIHPILRSRSEKETNQKAKAGNMTKARIRDRTRTRSALGLNSARQSLLGICTISFMCHGLTTPEPSRAGPMTVANLHHLDELRCMPGGGSDALVKRRVCYHLI